MMLATLLSIVKNHGYSAVSSPTPEEALHICEQRPQVRACLSSVVFAKSGLTGVHLAQRLGQLYGTRSVLTSHHDRRLLTHIAGFDGYPFLPQPLSAAAVLAAVGECWRRGGGTRARSPQSGPEEEEPGGRSGPPRSRIVGGDS